MKTHSRIQEFPLPAMLALAVTLCLAPAVVAANVDKASVGIAARVGDTPVQVSPPEGDPAAGTAAIGIAPRTGDAVQSADTADAAKKKSVFKGTVVDEKAQPVAGANVTVVAAVNDEEDESAPPPGPPGGLGMRGGIGVIRRAARAERSSSGSPVFFTGRSDAAGAFAVEAEGNGPFRLRVEAAGFATIHVLKPKSGETNGAIALSRGYRLGGSVADIATAAPVRDAEVLAIPDDDHGFADPADPARFAALVRTSRDGAFAFPNLAEGFYTLRVLSPGRALLESDDHPVGPAAPARPAALYLHPGFDVPGKVVDPAGKPLVGIRLTAAPARGGGNMIRGALRGGFPNPVAVTGKDGRFTLRGVPADGKFTLEVRSKDYAPFSSDIAAPRAGAVAAAIDVRLDKGVTLRGTLVDSEKKPVSAALAAQITLRDPKTRRVLTRIDRDPQSLHSGPSGEFTIDRIPAGTARVNLQVEGFKEIDKRDVVLARETKGADLGTIALDKGGRLAGRVVSSEGTPIASAKVDVTGSGRAGGGPGGGMWGRSFTATTDAEGRFTVVGLGEGDVNIEATSSGYSDGSKRGVTPGGDPVEIVLNRAGSVAGRVVVGDPPAPVANFTVQPEPKNPGGMLGAFRAFGLGGSQQKKSDPGGHFSVQGLEPGTYTLTVRADGLQDLVREGVDVRAGEATDLGDLTLTAGGTVRGRVVRQPEGIPVAGAAVRVKQGGLFNIRALLGQDRVTLTDLAGKFELKGLPIGPTTVVVEPENLAKAEVQASAVEEGTTAEEVVVTVGKGGRIEGHVVGPDGLPQAGVMVTAMSGMFDMSARAMGSTDETGHYAIENLAPGSYNVMNLAIALPTDDEEEPQAGSAPARGRGFGGMDTAQADVKDGETTTVNFGEKKIKVSGLVKRKTGATGGSQIVFVPADAATAGRISVQMGSADDTGHYEVSLTHPGEYVVQLGTAGAMGGTTIKVTIPDKPEVTQDLVVPEGAVSGRVTDSSGAPLKSAMVIAQDSSQKTAATAPRGRAGRAANTAVTGEDGSYRIEGLSAGNWDFTFSLEGYATESRESVEIKGSGEVSGVDAIMGAGAPFRLRVLTPSGSPVAGALVFATRDGEPLAGIGGMTREDGSWETKQLKPGLYGFQAISRDYAPGVTRDVPVGGEKDADSATITLSVGGGAKVIVRDGGKQPVSGATVALANTSDPDLVQAIQAMTLLAGGQSQTTANGSITIKNLPAGKYEATVTKGDKKVVQSVTVEDGSTAILTVTLE